MLNSVVELRPPAPVPRVKLPGFFSLLRVLATNPLEAWTVAHFEEPIVACGLPVGNFIVLSDPAGIRRVLLENSSNYRKDWLQRRVLSAGLASGLLGVEGTQWRTQRRTLAPFFSPKMVSNLSAIMVAAARRMTERLHSHEGETIDVADEITRTTLDILARTIFSDGLGRSPAEFQEWMKDYFETIGRIDVMDLLGVPGAIPRPGHWRMRHTLRLFEDAVDRMIFDRRRCLAEDSDHAAQDVLSLLLKAKTDGGATLSEQEIRANIFTFIVAGHETTANSLAWSLFLASRSQAWRERVRMEADRELEGDIGRLPDRLVETRAVVSEALRLYPPIAAISRAALGSDVLAGRSIRRGTVVVIAPYVLHRHRLLWTRPDFFDPGRFLCGTREKIDRFSYLPFGAGPRSCIGSAFALQEASIVLATIIRDFDLELAERHSVWPVQKVTLRPRGGLPMFIKKRRR